MPENGIMTYNFDLLVGIVFKGESRHSTGKYFDERFHFFIRRFSN